MAKIKKAKTVKAPWGSRDRSDPLTLDSPDSNDYTLDPEAGSVWISVKNLSIWILPRPEGVLIQAYPRFDEADDPAIDEIFVDYPEETKAAEG